VRIGANILLFCVLLCVIFPLFTIYFVYDLRINKKRKAEYIYEEYIPEGEGKLSQTYHTTCLTPS